MADLGEPIRVIEVEPEYLPVPEEPSNEPAPEPDLDPEPELEPVEALR